MLAKAECTGQRELWVGKPQAQEGGAEMGLDTCHSAQHPHPLSAPSRPETLPHLGDCGAGVHWNPSGIFRKLLRPRPTPDKLNHNPGKGGSSPCLW